MDNNINRLGSGFVNWPPNSPNLDKKATFRSEETPSFVNWGDGVDITSSTRGQEVVQEGVDVTGSTRGQEVVDKGVDATESTRGQAGVERGFTTHPEMHTKMIIVDGQIFTSNDNLGVLAQLDEPTAVHSVREIETLIDKRW